MQRLEGAAENADELPVGDVKQLLRWFLLASRASELAAYR